MPELDWRWGYPMALAVMAGSALLLYRAFKKRDWLYAAVCRALTVLCVAPDRESLSDLRRATVSADWELARGAVGEDEAIAAIESERPHVLVAFGTYPRLIAAARERLPGLRVVADRDAPGVDVVASLDGVREAVLGRERPGGPVAPPR
jgi:hypothetical protein